MTFSLDSLCSTLLHLNVSRFRKSRSQINVQGHMRKYLSKVAGATSSEGFLVLTNITIFLTPTRKSCLCYWSNLLSLYSIRRNNNAAATSSVLRTFCDGERRGRVSYIDNTNEAPRQLSLSIAQRKTDWQTGWVYVPFVRLSVCPSVRR